MRRLALPLALLLLATPALARPEQGLVVHPSPKPVPALDIRDAEGKPAPLPQGKAVLLNLWASWCGPCVAELPTIDRARPKLQPEGVEVVALSLDRSGKVAVVNTYARLGIANLEVRTDESRAAAEVLGAPYLPVTLLIDRQGREAARFVGPADWDGPEAAALLKALAAGKPITAGMAPPPPGKAVP